MEPGSILFISGIMIMVMLFISQPFFRDRSSRAIVAEQRISPLMAEREQIIDALLELDFDYKMGKVPAEDYPIQRNMLLSRGAQIMKQLDIMSADSTASNGISKIDIKGDMRETKPSHKTSEGKRSAKRLLTTPDDDLEILLAARRRERSEKAGGFCSQCGAPIQQSDRFCPRCGEALLPADDHQ